MNPASTFKPAESVMVRSMGDEAVLLDVRTGSYFGLNAVGYRVWLLLESGNTVAQVSDQIAAEFDVTREQAEGDVRALVTQLGDKGLVAAAAGEA